MRRNYCTVTLSVFFLLLYTQHANAVETQNGYSLKSQCARDAYSWLVREFGRRVATYRVYDENSGGTDVVTFISYTDHYNFKTSSCYINLALTSNLSDGILVNDTIRDANENTTIGVLDVKIQGKTKTTLDCNFQGKPCANQQEWEQLATAFMQQ